MVTSGGVSQGDYDVVKEALAPLGTVWFGGVAMQPGKPQGFGFVGGDGEARVPIFTLPGNPVSSYLSFQQFVLPALRTMMGRTPVSRPTRRARRDPRHPLARRAAGSSCAPSGARTAAVTPVGGHGSHLIGDLAHSNALIVVPEDVTEVAKGSEVSVLLLDRDF